MRDGLPHVKVRGTILVKKEWLDTWLEGFVVDQEGWGAEVDRIVNEAMGGLDV